MKKLLLILLPLVLVCLGGCEDTNIVHKQYEYEAVYNICRHAYTYISGVAVCCTERIKCCHTSTPLGPCIDEIYYDDDGNFITNDIQ